MDTVDIVVLLTGIWIVLISIVGCIFIESSLILFSFGGIYLILLVIYEIERDKEHEAFLKEVYGDDW